jgi:hypothetical protein
VSIRVGQDESRQVTRNLAEALPYLRHPELPKAWWIDAIRINQEDDLEKSHQVRRMGEICRLGWRVLAWLGPPGDSRSHAIDCLNSLAEKIEPGDQPLDIKPAIDLPADNLHWSDPLKIFCWARRELNALYRLLGRCWSGCLCIW